MLHIAAQNSSTLCYSNLTGQSWTRLPRENLQVGAERGHPGSTWTHWTSTQRWNQEDQCPGGVETEISTGAEECEGQQKLHRYSSNKREAKDRVSSLLDRDGEEEMMKCTEKHEVLYAFFAPVFCGKISSQVSHTPEATTTKIRQIRDKMHIRAGQYMHLWLTRADQCHFSLEFSSKQSCSPGTARKQMSQNLTSLLGKITWQLLLKVISK